MDALAADPSEVLFVLAEVAVAFTGFASIVAIVQARLTPSALRFDLFRFWVMLAFSLATLTFALVPFLLHFFGLAPPPSGGAPASCWPRSLSATVSLPRD